MTVSSEAQKISNEVRAYLARMSEEEKRPNCIYFRTSQIEVLKKQTKKGKG